MSVNDEVRPGSRDKAGKYLTFKLGPGHYGLEILKVREIIGLIGVTAIPLAPAHVKGVINLRGTVIPVVDLRQKFGMDEVESTAETRIIVAHVGDREIGVDLIPDHVSPDPHVEMPDIVIPPDGIHFREVITGHERRYIEAALEAAGGVQKRAAELLHIKATTLNEMIKRYDMLPRRRKGAGDVRDDGEGSDE